MSFIQCSRYKKARLNSHLNEQVYCLSDKAKIQAKLFVHVGDFRLRPTPLSQGDLIRLRLLLRHDALVNSA